MPRSHCLGLTALVSIVLACWLSSTSAAQQTLPPVAFEAASVKKSDPAAQGQSIRRQPGGRFSTVNTPLRMLITFAYQIQPYQLIGGPGWIGESRFDIIAKLEGDPPPTPPGAGPDPMMLALRTLLADRFKLVVHRETRELDIYALTMARPGGKPGAALKPAGPECSPESLAARRGAAPGTLPPLFCGIQNRGPGRIAMAGMPLSFYANFVSGQVGRFVVDRTGLTGNWDFELTFAPPQAPPGAAAQPAGVVDPNLPDLFTALREQLGLKMDPTKGPVDVLVVDSAQQPVVD